MFKTIASDITTSGQALAVFGKEARNIYRDFASAINGIKNKTGGISQFSFGRIFGNKLSEQDIQAIRNYNDEIRKYNNFTEDAVSPQTAFYRCLGNSSSAAQKLARDANGAAVSEEALTTASNQLTLAQRAATTASKALGVALNIALNVGLMLAINAIITGISKLVNRQKELRENISETAEKAKEQTDNLNDLIKSYEKFADKVSYTAEEKEQLKSIQDKLSESYHSEVDDIDLVNGKYDEEIEKLRELKKEKLADAELSLIAEREQTSKESRYDNLGGNKNFLLSPDWFNSEDYDKITKEFEEKLKHSFTTEIGWINEAIGYDSKLFFSGNAEDRVEQIQTAMSVLKDYGYTSLGIYSELNKKLSEYQGYVDAENDAISNLAENMFQQYELDNPYNEVGEDSYLAWKNGLLSTAGNDKDLKSALSKLAENQFPDYAKYFNNLEKAKKQFSAYEGTNKYNFLKDLTADDLDYALQIPDLFADGLEAAAQKIAAFKADPNNKIKVFDIANYQDDIEDVYGNIEKLQSAIGKIDEGKFDFSGDIKDLIKAFPEYSEEILSASDDTDKLRNVLQRLLDSQPNDLIKSLQELKKDLVTDKERKAVDNLIESLRKSTYAAASVNSLADALDEVNDKQSLLSTVWKEMKTDGHISVSTYKSLTEAGDEYAGIVTDNNGILTVSAEKVKELIEKNYELEIATDRNTAAQLRYNAARYSATMTDAEKDAINQRIDLLDSEIKANETALGLINSFDYTADDTTDTTKEPKSVKDFKREYKVKKHLLEMGELSEKDFYKWLDSESQKVYGNLKDYEDDLWGYKEEIYKWQKEQEQDLFNQRTENLEELADKSLDNNDFEGARKAANTEKTEIQQRIVELKTSGKQNVDDEIESLNDKLKELDDTLNDISSKEYEFNISVKEDKIDNLDKEYELTGDTSVFDKKIEVYNGMIADANDEINRLLGLGYSMESDEIQNLLDKIADYSDEIASIWDSQTEVIKDNVDEQIKALDREIDTTGDTKLYSEKIKVYKDGQESILEMIEFYREQGYAEDSEVIKNLKAQWQDYQDSINDTLQAQADAQVEAYNEIMDKQKEMLEEQKAEQDEYFDKQIEALEDKKSALEKVNEEIEKENELEEKRQAIAEAERNLYKNVRLNYAGNGQWVQKAREEDLQAVKGAEEEAQKAREENLKQQEIQAIEDQITAINDAKTDYDNIIGKQITAIEESEKSFEKAMKDSYEVRKELDYEFIASIVGIDKANEYKTNAEKATAEVQANENNNNAQTDKNNSPAQVVKDRISSDDAMKLAYNMAQKGSDMLKNVSLDEFKEKTGKGFLTSLISYIPKLGDKAINGNNTVNSTMNNSPAVINNITVNGAGKSGEELANEIASTCENKIIQAFTIYGNDYRNTFNKLQYNNR